MEVGRMSAPRPVHRRIKIVAPARKRRRLFRSIVPFLAKTFLFFAVVLAGFWLLNKGMRPIRLISHEKRERDKVVAEYNALRQENEQLRRQLAHIKTQRGISQAARKQGFVKPGEISLVIPESTTPKPD
jgi:cell division protein FtsB